METNLKSTLDLNWTSKNKFTYFFGPCSAESWEQLDQTAAGISNAFKSVHFRAGIWKPRTRPNSFEGVGSEGLKWLADIKAKYNFKVTTEVATPEHVEACLKAGIDVLWIGARTTVNPFSVQEIADSLKGVNIPVYVKNPIHADLSLWLGALERVNASGIQQLGAIHRGFFMKDNAPYRNFPNWDIAVQLKAQLPNLPIICDASHISGTPSLIPYVAQRGIDLDMDGLMIETHHQPQKALSDAQQQITPEELEQLIANLVFKKSSSTDAEFKNKLELLREEIDKIDDDLMEKLAMRMEIARQIGVYKGQNNVTILQIERWREILARSLKNGASLELSDNFIKSVYNAIHDESIEQQTIIQSK